MTDKCAKYYKHAIKSLKNFKNNVAALEITASVLKNFSSHINFRNK